MELLIYPPLGFNLFQVLPKTHGQTRQKCRAQGRRFRDGRPHHRYPQHVSLKL
jgi:hypothetical protein